MKMNNEATIRKRGLDYFRRMIALVYREIGVLTVVNHRTIAEKVDTTGGFFGANRKIQAKQLYKLSLTDISIAQTKARYSKRTGLTLEDIHEAFRVGNWGSISRGFAFGGPKWTEISRVTMELGSAIESNALGQIERLTTLIDTLEHNNGKIVSKFSQLD